MKRLSSVSEIQNTKSGNELFILRKIKSETSISSLKKKTLSFEPQNTQWTPFLNKDFYELSRNSPLTVTNVANHVRVATNSSMSQIPTRRTSTISTESYKSYDPVVSASRKFKREKIIMKFRNSIKKLKTIFSILS